MTKMNMHDRVQTTKLMMQDVHGDKLLAAAKAVRVTSDAAHKAYYGSDYARMQKLPNGWLPTIRRDIVQFNGVRILMDFNMSGRVSVNLPGNDNFFSVNTDEKLSDDTRRIRDCDRPHNAVRVNKGHPAFDAFRALADANKEFDDAKQKLTNDANEVFNTLKSLNTLEAVGAKWPEAHKYAAKVVTGTTSTAIAPNFAELNKKLGLPA